MSKTTAKPLAYFFLLLLLLNPTLVFPLTGTASSKELSIPEISSYAAVLMEFSTGEIIFSKNAQEPLPPASLTKIMTLLLAYEALEEGRVSPEEEVTISQKAWQTSGSQMFLNVGQRVPYMELIAGIASISANDACVAIAEHLLGSEELFVREMNRKAEKLGLVNTLFQNASGLHHPEHYTSAEDVARLAHYFISRYPEALEFHSLKEYTFNGITQYNRNPLLGRFPGADGLKTGHTSSAGYCLVGTATQGGMRFLTVIMNASSNAERLKDSEILLNYAFRNYVLHKVFQAGDVVAAVDVTVGEELSVDLLAGQAAELVIPFNRQEDLEVRLLIPQHVQAPVEQGESLGSAQVILDDKVLAEIPLLAAREVKKAGRLALLYRYLVNFFASLWSRLLDS